MTLIEEDVVEEQQHPETVGDFHRQRTQVASDLAQWIVRYRLRHKLTQVQLAAKIGVSQPVIARLEIGDFEPRLVTLRNLARALGATFVITVSPTNTSTKITPVLY